MWYITVAFFLTIFTIFEFSRRKVGQNYIFNIAWMVLTFMLVFRYGQGTDYYAYYLVYQNIDDEGPFFVNALEHGEIGWYMLNLAANKIGMTFFLFLGIISFIEMLLMRRFIINYSPYKVFSLLLLYPTFYLTACYSTIRQGLVLCVFLGLCVEFLINRKYLKYYFAVLCLVFIHTSAVALLVIPLGVNFKFNRHYISGSVILGIGCIFAANRYSVIDSYSGYIGGGDIIAGLLVRLILFFIILRLHRLYQKCGNDNEIESFLFKIYLLGILIFLLLAQSSTLSQRLTMPFKAIEVVLIPTLIYANRNVLPNMYKIAKTVIVPISFYVVVSIMNVEFVKNIYSYINQGNYYSWVSPIDYPYSCIFDQNAIRSYISNFDEEVD